MVNEGYEPSEREEIVLELFKEGRDNSNPWGRVNPLYIRERTDLDKGKVEYALRNLSVAGWIRQLNRGGLYELVSDPREARSKPDRTGDGEVNELANVVEEQKREIQRLREQTVDQESVSETKVILSRIEDELQSETGSRDRIKMLVEDAQTAVDNALGEDH